MQKEVITNFENVTRETADTKKIACTRGKDSTFSVTDSDSTHSSFWGKSPTLELT